MTRTALALALACPLAACDAPAEPGALYTFTSDASGFDTHSFYYDTGSAVIVFDAQFTDALADALIADIAAHTDSPITHVVVTHPNPDKFNGTGRFRELGAEIVASEATAAAIPGVHAYKRSYFIGAGAFTEDTYPAEASVDRTFAERLELGGAVELQVLANPGVASTQTVAYIPAIDALIVGDLVHHRAHAWLEGGIEGGAPKPDLAGWKAALDELRAWPEATVYGGRGEPGPVEAVVPAQQAYLDAAQEIVADYTRDVDPTEFSGPAASEHYAALTAAFRAEFPDHALDYLIGYGVYGLVQSTLADRS